MQTPADYFDRYHNLAVPSPDGSGDLATGISVDRYRLGAGQAHINERARVGRKVQKDLAIRRKSDPTAGITVRVHAPDGDDEHTFDELKFTDDNQLWALLRYPYVGKGSPEAIQVLLQLASVALPGSPAIVEPAAFQAYCDRWLGLDCNGLVGNYLRHVREGIAWSDVTATKAGVSPNNNIKTMWDSLDGEVRSAAEQVDFNDLNLLVLVDKSGKIIPGGSSGYGHIMISQPREIEFETGLKATLGVADDEAVPGILVIESTGAGDAADSGRNGLVKSFYAYADHKPQKGVIRVRRGFNGKAINVRIKGAEWSP